MTRKGKVFLPFTLLMSYDGILEFTQEWTVSSTIVGRLLEQSDKVTLVFIRRSIVLLRRQIETVVLCQVVVKLTKTEKGLIVISFL